jgi:hypothetical protein
MKSLALILIIILAKTCPAQPRLTHLDKNSIPKLIHYTGQIIQAARWVDSAGDNIVILSATKSQSKNAPDDGVDGALYACHYLVSHDSVNQTWKVYDYIKQCPVDMILYFVDKAFAVTDLNNDGKAEVWIMYKVSCQGDVSPVPMKIIMYEGNKKFAVRGTTRVQPGENEFAGGEFSFDDAFRNAPLVFRQYAENLWKQHKTERWNQ